MRPKLSDEHKKIEVEEELARYKFAVEQSTQQIAFADLNGKVLFTNDAWAKSHGYSKNELIGKHLSVFHPKEEFPKIIANVQELMRKRKYSGEVMHKRKDGSTFLAWMDAYRIDHRGKTGFFVGIATDITEKMRVEESLVKEKSILDQVIRSNPYSIAIGDTEGHITRVNPAFIRLFGSIPPKWYNVFKDPMLLKEGYGKLFARLRKGEIVRFPEVWYDAHQLNPHLPAARICISAVSFSVRDLKGKKDGYVIMHEDVTRRKKAEKAVERYQNHLEELVKERTAELKANEGKLRSIVDTVPEGIDVVDQDYKILWMNNRLKSRFGKKAIGRKCYNVYKDDHQICPNCPLKEGIKIGETKKISVSPIDKGKTWEISHTGMLQNGKKVVLEVFKDITEERKMNEELKQSYEKIKELDKMKTEFLSMVSHELKTPLTPIRIQLQRLLSKEMPREESHAALSMVLRNALRLEHLINDVLDISRLQSKRLYLNSEKFNFRELAEKVISTYEENAKSHGISLKLEFPQRLFVDADRFRLEQVLINLIDNAIRHGQPKNIIVSGDKNTTMMHFSVADDGKGISIGDQKHLFELFYQGKEVRGMYIGSGLGLPICKGIIEAHGGRIKVKSILGKGTTVSFTLPLKPLKPLKTSHLINSVKI